MERSHFDGTVLQLVGYSLLAGLLTAVTFGIGYPWALCMLKRWEVKHTYIESRRLQFDGKGLQLLGMWVMLALIPFIVLIAAIFLTRPFLESKSGTVVAGFIYMALIIAALFYSYFVQIQIKKWTVKHTEFEIHLLQYEAEPTQAAPVYERSTPAPVPRPVPFQSTERDWVEKIGPALPLVYVLWFCGIAAAVFFVLNLIFK